MFGVQHVAVLPLVCFWIREIHVYERLRLVVNEWTCQIDVCRRCSGTRFSRTSFQTDVKISSRVEQKKSRINIPNAIEIHHLQLDLCIPRKFLRKRKPIKIEKKKNNKLCELLAQNEGGQHAAPSEQYLCAKMTWKKRRKSYVDWQSSRISRKFNEINSIKLIFR